MKNKTSIKKRSQIGIVCFILVALGFVSCRIQKPLMKVTSDNNKTYDVDYLFEHDGCKVYRFEDMGNYVYFTNCKGEVTSLERDSAKTRVINVVRTDGSN